LNKIYSSHRLLPGEHKKQKIKHLLNNKRLKILLLHGPRKLRKQSLRLPKIWQKHRKKKRSMQQSLRQKEKKQKPNKKLNYLHKRRLSRRLIRLQNLQPKKLRLKDSRLPRPTKLNTRGKWLLEEQNSKLK
jgi:hypothetical protein